MVMKINLVLKEVLENKSVPKEDLDSMNSILNGFISALKESLKSLKIKADVFVGGSAAKGTMIRKGDYDLDIFVRFDKKYGDSESSRLLAKALAKMKGIEAETVHGSRDYFKIGVADNLFLEVIPVKKIKNPKEADNITDLSYSHVNYVKRKIKGKVLDDIKLAKAFTHARNCYGAESYIKGFSGYGLELLIYHYGSFLKFMKAIAKMKKGEKVVIDIEKNYKNKSTILLDLNESKLHSPIVLVDPTFKTRNVLAALNEETLDKFKEDVKKFLKNPSVRDFERVGLDIDKAKKNANKNKYDFVGAGVSTGKQTGDIAGSKLLKFYNHVADEILRYFEIEDRGFEYLGGTQTAQFFFSVKPRKEILVQGPSVKDEKNVKRFKKMHKSTFIKSGRVYAREKVGFTLKEFFDGWKKKHKGRMREMSVIGFELGV